MHSSARSFAVGLAAVAKPVQPRSKRIDEAAGSRAADQRNSVYVIGQDRRLEKR